MVTDKDMGYRELLKRLAGAKQVSVLVGIRGAQGSDLVTYAAANEFGTERIPERSFLRATVDNERVKYTGLLEQAADRLLDGDTPAAAFGILGMVAVGDVQRRIRNRVPPPNAPLTIAKKGSDVPLIDTGRLRQSIDYVVEVV